LSISVTSNSTICIGESATYSASGATNYTWTPNIFLNNPNLPTVVITPTTTATYTVIGNNAGCTGSITAVINVANNPTVTVNNPTICLGNSIILTANGATSYTWDTGATTPTISVNPSTDSNYTVTGSSNSCTNTAVANVSVTTVPSLTVSPDITIIKGSQTNLSVTGGSGTYTWTPVTNLSCSTCSSTIAAPLVTTQYCVISSINTCNVTDCVLVSVEIDCSTNNEYATPSAFSPNGDGLNDQYCLNGWGECVTSFQIAIYNRWGEKVYESEDVGFCWDGTYLGNPLNSGVFVFYIKAEIKNSGSITRKGNITIVK